MNPTLLLARLTAWLQRLACRVQESERLRRDRQVLSSMSAQELRDIGISHAALATAAYHLSRCE
jgi:uncharacterized protein YjiS (DUF1127 family)